MAPHQVVQNTGQTLIYRKQHHEKQEHRAVQTDWQENICGVYFCVSFLTLNVEQLMEKLQRDCVVSTTFFCSHWVFFFLFSFGQ